MDIEDVEAGGLVLRNGKVVLVDSIHRCNGIMGSVESSEIVAGDWVRFGRDGNGIKDGFVSEVLEVTESLFSFIDVDGDTHYLPLKNSTFPFQFLSLIHI